MADHSDPMIAAAQTIVAVRSIGSAQDDARATVGRLEPVPGGTNVIASRVDLWLDVRHPEDAVTAMLVEKIHGQAQKLAAFEGCTVHLTEESFSNTVHFDAGLTRSLAQSVRRLSMGRVGWLHRGWLTEGTRRVTCECTGGRSPGRCVLGLVSMVHCWSAMTMLSGCVTHQLEVLHLLV